jgi:hypothetical protein
MLACRSKLVGSLLLAVSLCALLTCRPDSWVEPSTRQAYRTPDLPPLAIFQDMTTVSQVRFTYRNGEEANHHTLLESIGGGVALLDYDGDGLLDLFVTGGGYFDGPDRKQIKGYPCKLYRNLGNWKFQDVTAQVGLDRVRFYSHGCAVADYDCDGWPDLLITGYGGLALFRNVDDGRGGRKFVEVTEPAGLQNPLWNTSAAWADLDGDGYPDLYVCRYLDWSWQTHRTCPGDDPTIPREICPPQQFRGLPHALYRNNRDGTFTEVGQAAGLAQGVAVAAKGLGVVIVDVDDDGRPDIYAVNDTTHNLLYLNRSQPGQFRFEEIGLESGVAMGNRGQPDGSMGVDAADYDGSGRPSLWVTTFEDERPALYRNQCRPNQRLFQYVTWETDIARVGPGFVGFGTGFIDLDNDGWEDLVIANGHVRRHPTRCALRQAPLLLRNLSNERFLNVTAQGGGYFQQPHRGRGLAIGDLDNDGRPDLVISHLNEPVTLLRNQPQGGQAPANHWLGIELIGRNHREITGAKVTLEVGGRRLTRFAKGGGSYLSSGDRRLLFGLGPDVQVGRLTVSWPWGKEQHWNGLKCDRYWMLVEGNRQAQPPHGRRRVGP